MPNLSQLLSRLQAERKSVSTQVQRLDQAIAAIRGLVGRNGGVTSIAGRPRRRLSLAARKRIAAAQRARWAKVKALKKAA